MYNSLYINYTLIKLVKFILIFKNVVSPLSEFNTVVSAMNHKHLTKIKICSQIH